MHNLSKVFPNPNILIQPSTSNISTRRKKIKCSGEPNCRTCQERGIVCEGFPNRKRPKRDSFESSILDPLPAGIDHARRLSVSKRPNPKQRPGSLLRLANATKSEDSGYGSLSPGTLGPSSTAEFPMELARVGMEDFGKGSRTSSEIPFVVDIWNFGGEQLAESSDQRRKLPKLPSPTTAAEIAPPAHGENLSSQDDISWWNNIHHLINSKTTNLSTAARVVFGDSAQPALPKKKSPTKTTIDLDGMPVHKPDSPKQPTQAQDQNTSTRRQTVQLPLPQQDVPTQPGIFDDMALLLAARTPGQAPILNDLSWWNFNSEIGAMLSQAGEILKEGVTENPIPVEEIPRKGKRAAVGGFYW